MLTFNHNTLHSETTPLLTHIPPNITFHPAGPGGFLTITLNTPTHYLQQPLGQLPLTRFLAAYRNEPFWMRPKSGTGPRDIPVETQLLFLELPHNNIALLVPLISPALRCSLRGSDDGLFLVAESGTPAVTADHVTGLYVAVGSNLQHLCDAGAAAVAAHLNIQRRHEKTLPPFINDFGWCTWDAFYQDVSHEKVRTGLESFQQIGVRPRLLILDDGWQSEVRRGEAQGQRLTSLQPNAKFSHDLSATVRMAREEFGVRHFLAWHALQGYWGGLDAQAMATYGAVETARDFSPGVQQNWKNANNNWWGAVAGIVPPDQAGQLFQDYHARLKLQGVDGVKVDNQAAMEGLAASHGRVTMYRQYRAALEESASNHFGGALIHCMSCANDLLYTAGKTPLVRTSGDFYPDRPETHGMHLWANAVVATWFGGFVHPDWDMFQSGHERAGFHAAARAISGGPVYVSDKPGVHDAALLRRLVLSDGTVLRCPEPAVLTHDGLFGDPTRDAVLLKIWNLHRHGGGVIGVFNCRQTPPPLGETAAPPITGLVRASDVAAIRPNDGPFVLYGMQTGKAHLVSAADPMPVTLESGGWELLHVLPLGTRRAAVIGLVDKLNAPEAIEAIAWHGPDNLHITLRDGGTFALWTHEAPRLVTVDGAPASWKIDERIITIELAVGAPRHVHIEWLAADGDK